MLEFYWDLTSLYNIYSMNLLSRFVLSQLISEIASMNKIRLKQIISNLLSFFKISLACLSHESGPQWGQRFPLLIFGDIFLLFIFPPFLPFHYVSVGIQNGGHWCPPLCWLVWQQLLSGPHSALISLSWQGDTQSSLGRWKRQWSPDSLAFSSFSFNCVSRKMHEWKGEVKSW